MRTLYPPSYGKRASRRLDPGGSVHDPSIRSGSEVNDVKKRQFSSGVYKVWTPLSSDKANQQLHTSTIVPKTEPILHHTQ
jgi:hypothetical protein